MPPEVVCAANAPYIPAKNKQRPCLVMAGAHRFVSVCQIGLDQHLQKLIPVDVPDEVAGIIMRGYVCRVLGQDVAYDLVDRIISLLYQGIINDRQSPLEFNLLLITHGKGHCFIEHGAYPLNGNFGHSYYSRFSV